MRQTDRFRIAVIGCGGIATSSHGPSYARYAAQHPGIELAACCDQDPARAGRFARDFGFARAYSDYQEMLDAEQPNAVCLLVPPERTCELTCAILPQGYPLLLEKPPGMTLAELAQMRRAAEQSGTPHQVAFNRRFMPLVQAFKRYFAERFAPEEVQFVRYDFTRVERADPDFSTTAIHGIDTAAFLAGAAYERVNFDYQPLPQFGAMVANTSLKASLTSGAQARLDFCPLAGVVTERATLHLHNHTFFIDLPVGRGYDAPGRLVHLEKGRVVLDLAGPEAAGGAEGFLLNGFYAENEAFFEAVRAGQTLTSGLATAAQAVALAEAMRERRAEVRF